MEAFPDEGDMDMPRSPAAYRDVAYPYMLPDHIQALIDALASRSDRE